MGQNNRYRTCASGRELWRRKFLPSGKPPHWQVQGGALEPQRGVQQQGCGGQSGEDLTQGDQCLLTSTPSLRCLPAYGGRWGLGAEARASEVRPQGEDWGWLREDSLRGLVCHSWGSSGRSLGLPERQGTTVVGCARRGGPTTGASCSIHSQTAGHHLHKLQRWVRATAVFSDPRGRHDSYSCRCCHLGSCEQVCTNQPLLLFPLAWAGNRRLRVAHM